MQRDGAYDLRRGQDRVRVEKSLARIRAGHVNLSREYRMRVLLGQQFAHLTLRVTTVAPIGAQFIATQVSSQCALYKA